MFPHNILKSLVLPSCLLLHVTFALFTPRIALQHASSLFFERKSKPFNIRDGGLMFDSSSMPALFDANKMDGYLDEEQLSFCKAYINEHHKNDMLLPFLHAFSSLGAISLQKNMWLGGSYTIIDASVVDITQNSIFIEATVKDRGKTKNELMEIALNSELTPEMVRTYENLPQINPFYLTRTKVPIDNFVRRINRLYNIVRAYEATGKMIQMGVQLGGVGVGKMRDNLYLNQVPHNRFVRKYFYDMAADAALDAVIMCSARNLTNRMKMTVLFPELNPLMDSYRIGTLLELARSIAIKLAEQNLRVRVCVQGSMGVGIFTGIPKQLTGVHTLLQKMDWESGPGEENEGMVGNYVNFGFVGKEYVVNDNVSTEGKNVTKGDDVFLILCPQNMIGLETSIIGPLSEMVKAAGDRPVILLNPDLTDKVSSQGQQSIRGRQQRLDFTNSFQSIFHFQNMYYSGTSYFPIIGSITKLGPCEPWVAHQRRDLVDNGGEVYLPVYSAEGLPDNDVLLKSFS